MDYENVKEGVEHHCELWLAQCKAKWWKEQHDLILKKMVELESNVLQRHDRKEWPERYPVVVIGKDLGHYRIRHAFYDDEFLQAIKPFDGAGIVWLYADELLTPDSGKA